MLDAITDFWKPVRKNQVDKLRPEELQIGSSVLFGNVPQALLSGRKFQVGAVSVYQFGMETLVSFVLSQERDPGISMIVAEADGDQYLAISRRISISDRMRLFDSRELENAMEKADVTQLVCRESGGEFKGWMVPAYKREIQGLKGRIFRGDYRRKPLPEGTGEGQEFDYFLLVAANNEQAAEQAIEHAIEIERYADGRVEVYATIYRQIVDIIEVNAPSRTEMSPPDVRLSSERASGVAAVLPMGEALVSNSESPARKPFVEQPAASVASYNTPEENQAMSVTAVITKNETVNGATTMNVNEAESPFKPKLNAPYGAAGAHDVKAVSHRPDGQPENEAVECDLRVANKLIDEAIRNEMRLSDVVRRIIALPVAYPEAVQIPITLTDEDFALLAIRYGIPAADRNAIKRRIMEDLNDFSGGRKPKAA